MFTHIYLYINRYVQIYVQLYVYTHGQHVYTYVQGDKDTGAGKGVEIHDLQVYLSIHTHI